MKDHVLSKPELPLYGALAAISAVFQIVHLGFETPWGMWIDIVAVPWLIAFFLFGLRGGILVSLIGSIIITFVAPSTWLGAVAKFIATVPVIFTLYGVQRVFHIPRPELSKVKFMLIALVAGLMVRAVITVIFNYYFALPIWIPGKTTAELMAMIPWFIIAGINAIQGVIDVVLAWVLVYRYKLSRFATENR